MPASRAASWIRLPIAKALARFTLLPSLHPARLAASHVAAAGLRTLHRHRSKQLLKNLPTDASMGIDDPALPLAMLPEGRFERLQLLLGAALNARHVRRTIARDELARLRTDIGSEGLAVARSPVAAALAHVDPPVEWEIERTAAICSAWGAAVLARALDAASPGVGERGRLRLPPESDVLVDSLSPDKLSAERALQVARDLLQLLEPAWLSSFPVTR